jgi:hypothetical protein
MPSSEFKRIVTELSSIGDSVNVSVTKDGIKFSTTGDIGSANITCRQATSVDKQAYSHLYASFQPSIVSDSCADIHTCIAQCCCAFACWPVMAPLAWFAGAGIDVLCTLVQEDAIVIDLNEPVKMNFALRYLNSFAKATPLSGVVSGTVQSVVNH